MVVVVGAACGESKKQRTRRGSRARQQRDAACGDVWVLLLVPCSCAYLICLLGVLVGLIIIITSAKSTFPTTIITTVETRLSHYYNLINYEVITIATMTDTNGSNHDSGIEAQRAKMSFLFREDVAPGLRLEMDLNRIFTSSESEFQQIDIVETYFGKVCL